MIFCVFLTRSPFKPCKIIVFCSSLQSQIWIRFLTNSVGGNCEHAFSYWKYKFFMKSPKHHKRYTGHSKENRLFLKFAFRGIFGPRVLIKHSTWALVTNSDLCEKGFFWIFMLPEISTFKLKPKLRIIIFQCNDEIFNFFWKSDNP